MREKTGARMPRANMQHILSLAVMVPDHVEEQQHIADETARRFALVVKAKIACQEQMQLLDIYAQKVLSEFSSNNSL